jgi:hypothetical protein
MLTLVASSTTSTPTKLREGAPVQGHRIHDGGGLNEGERFRIVAADASRDNILAELRSASRDTTLMWMAAAARGSCDAKGWPDGFVRVGCEGMRCTPMEG